MVFQLGLYYKQNRYRDIVQAGRFFQQALVVIPSKKKDAYIKVLQVIGDSCQKIDLLYDAREFYKKALELDPRNLKTLVKMRRNAERLSNESEIRDAEENISKSASHKDLLYEVFPLQKGQIPSWQLLLDGRPRTLELHFKGISQAPFPLLSIVFNEKVIWEGYVDKETLEVSLKPKLGDNLLVLTCLNRTAGLDKLTYR
jgi:tetratricopeptide (TPR) repeat protein